MEGGRGQADGGQAVGREVAQAGVDGLAEVVVLAAVALLTAGGGGGRRWVLR